MIPAGFIDVIGLARVFWAARCTATFDGCQGTLWPTDANASILELSRIGMAGTTGRSLAQTVKLPTLRSLRITT